MHDSNIGQLREESPRLVSEEPHPEPETNVVSTHVLVEQEQVEKLRELSRRTRVAQSEYLREAVDDLLHKYRRLEEGGEG